MNHYSTKGITCLPQRYLLHLLGSKPGCISVYDVIGRRSVQNWYHLDSGETLFVVGDVRLRAYEARVLRKRKEPGETSTCLVWWVRLLKRRSATVDLEEINRQTDLKFITGTGDDISHL